jgi:hypothetical protein
MLLISIWQETDQLTSLPVRPATMPFPGRGRVVHANPTTRSSRLRRRDLKRISVSQALCSPPALRLCKQSGSTTMPPLSRMRSPQRPRPSQRTFPSTGWRRRQVEPSAGRDQWLLLHAGRSIRSQANPHVRRCQIHGPGQGAGEPHRTAKGQGGFYLHIAGMSRCQLRGPLCQATG